MKVEIVETERSFRNLEDSWNQLFEAVSQKSVFLSWDWMYQWWLHYQQVLPAGSQLMIFVLHQAGQRYPQAIWPLFKYERKRSGMVFRYMGFLGAEIESSEYLDLLCDSSRAGEAIRAILQSDAFQAGASDVDILELDYLKEESNLYRHRKIIADHLNSSLYDDSSEPYLFVRLPADRDALLSGLSKKFRAELRSKLRKIKNSENLQFDLLQDESQAPFIVRELFRLHEIRFAEKGVRSVFNYEDRGRFHETIARQFLKKGWLRLHLVKDQDRIAGALYCFQFQDRLMHLQGGIDPAYYKLSFGIIMLFKAMELGIEEGVPVFDFLRGNESYKYRFTDQFIQLHRLTIPLSLKGRSAFKLYSFLKKGKNWLRTPIQ